MKIIYIDSDFKCHVSDDGTMAVVETDFFDGKCDAYIEGYRFIPSGSVWIRPDGTTFYGEMVAPWKDWRQIDAIQREYEREQLEALTTENEALVANMAQIVEEVYTSDIETLGI